MREEPQRIAGRLEGTLRIPDTTPSAIVVIAHPLPTAGGSMRNPLIARLAREAADRGWLALRFNFRGTGESAGAFSDGRDEHDDLADAVAHARAAAPGLPLGVVGFSFGARMLARWLTRGGRADTFVLLGLPAGTAIPPGSVVVNGELDQYGRADEVQREHPDARVIGVAGVDHFFSGKRDEMARVVMDQLALALP